MTTTEQLEQFTVSATHRGVLIGVFTKENQFHYGIYSPFGGVESQPFASEGLALEAGTQHANEIAERRLGRIAFEKGLGIPQTASPAFVEGWGDAAGGQ